MLLSSLDPTQTENNAPRHQSVMVQEVLQYLAPKTGGVFIDATLGDGGHTEALLERTAPHGKVLGIERDPIMLKRAEKYLTRFDDRIVFARASYTEIQILAAHYGFLGSDGVIFDLGVAMLHFSESRRGFSFQEDALLDMRFDPETTEETAMHILNTASYEDLARIIRVFGEEPETTRITKTIMRHRPISTARMLADLIVQTKQIVSRRTHPATRVFQALRIAVNQEIEALVAALPRAFASLRIGGVLAIIAYHSLEDRTAKSFLRTQKENGSATLLTKKPLRPSMREVRRNPRARSAKFRAAVRLR